jgi:hypothetical protein
MTGHEYTKNMAEALGVPIRELLVLARGNDPFSVGTPAHIRDAEWFTSLFDRCGFTSGVHLRRIHYQLVSEANVLLPNGDAYQNTERCWAMLSESGKKARILSFVDTEAFVDRRNPEPHIYCADYPSEPYCHFDELMRWRCHGIQAAAHAPVFDLPYPELTGYHSTAADQPYLLELWVEKSTMNDILKPLCSQMGVNLVTSIGFQSVTASVQLLGRAAMSSKPAHILYISDFDPAGERMPVAVARQCQYMIERRGYDVDLSVDVLMLSAEQAAKYQLPRIPIKDADRRKAGFEDRHGGGAVELDALEALLPSEFERVVRHAIQRYQDGDHIAKVVKTGEQARSDIAAEWSELARPFEDELEELRRLACQIGQAYQEPLSDLSQRLSAELEPVNERLAELNSEYQEAMDDYAPELPDKPEAVPDGPINLDPMFDSVRYHLEQLDAFKRHGVAA